MTVIHINQRQLANRWCVSEATLERWRSEAVFFKVVVTLRLQFNQLVLVPNFPVCLDSA